VRGRKKKEVLGSLDEQSSLQKSEIEQQLEHWKQKNIQIEIYQSFLKYNICLDCGPAGDCKSFEENNFKIVVEKIREFCKEEIKRLISDVPRISISSSSDFTPLQRNILIELATKIIQKSKPSISFVETKAKDIEKSVELKSPTVSRPIIPASPPVQRPRAKAKKQILTEEETVNRDPKEFIGETTRLANTSTLEIIQSGDVDPVPYALVKIVDVQDELAAVEFLQGGARGRIKLNELAGFEYRD